MHFRVEPNEPLPFLKKNGTIHWQKMRIALRSFPGGNGSRVVSMWRAYLTAGRDGSVVA